MLIIIKIVSRIWLVISRFFNHWANYYTFKWQRVTIDPGWKINGRLFIANGGKICIGNNFMANSGKNMNPIGGDTKMRLITTVGGEIRIGNNVGISNSTLYCCTKISIGDYVYIGGDCKIWDTDFHSLDPIERKHLGDNHVISKPIIFEDYVFLGSGSIVLKGITIGKNSIIGAGSVVTKNIPENEIWAGNPAKFVKRLM